MKGYDTYQFIYIAEDAVELKENEGYLEGTIPHLSMYALVGSNSEPATNNPKTGDSIMFYTAMLGFSILGFVSVFTKKKYN